MIDPTSCREQIARFIREETDEVQALSAILDEEHKLLTDNDMSALDPAMRRRQGCVARILHIEEEWRALCRGLSYSPDVHGLEQLLRWCDPTGSLVGDWQRCAAAAEHCRGLNDRNGILVAARLKTVQARLGVLVQSGRRSHTYDRYGSCASAVTGRVLAADA